MWTLTEKCLIFIQWRHLWPNIRLQHLGHAKTTLKAYTDVAVNIYIACIYVYIRVY